MPLVQQLLQKTWTPACRIESFRAATMAEEPGSCGAPRGVRRDSAHLDLGWCAGSSVQPRKQRAISGVSASSFVALQAQLYAAQEAAASLRQGGAEAEVARPRRLRAPGDGLGAANAGVREREARDAAQASAAGPAGVQRCVARSLRVCRCVRSPPSAAARWSARLRCTSSSPAAVVERWTRRTTASAWTS